MFTIGADVEVFAKDKTGKHKSLCGLIGGTKEEPKLMFPQFAGNNVTDQYRVQEDNVSLEFNIPYSTTRHNFKTYIQTALEDCADRLNKLGFELSTASAAVFDKSELTHPQALVFGCEPDYNAWKMIENKKPTCDVPELRTAGGHIHIGSQANMVEVIRWMDLYVGIPSVIKDTSEGALMRKKLYGKAGAMRPKPYGEEYRVLSNYWIFKPELVSAIYTGVSKAVSQAESGKSLPKNVGEDIQTVINTGDVTGAKTLCETFGLPF